MKIKKSFLSALGSLLLAVALGMVPATSFAEGGSPDQILSALHAAGVTARVVAAPTAPDATGETPLGFVVSGGNLSGSTAALFAFDSHFTATEVNGYTTFVPMLLTLLQGSGIQNISVQTYLPNQLPGDAQQVHNLIMANYLQSLSVYIRAYGTKVNGPAGVNVRFDLWMYMAGSSTPLYVGALEVPESMISLLNSLQQ